MLKKIIFAFIIGIFATIFFAQYDRWTHKKIVQFMQKVAKETLDGNFSCSVQSVSFFSPSIILTDLEMTALDAEVWQWRCKKFEVSCSWLQLLFKGVLDQHIIIEGYECRSTVKDNRLAIEPHLLAMMQQSFLPFSSQLKSIVFKNGCFHVDAAEQHGELLVYFNSSSLRIGNYLKTTMSIHDGHLLYKNYQYSEKIALDISCISNLQANAFDIGLQVAGTCVLPHLHNKGNCYIAGSWKSDCGRFSLRNAYNSLTIDPIIITEREIRINGRFPLSYAMHCLDALSNQKIEGIAQCVLKIHRDEPYKIEGQLIVEDVTANQHHLCDMAKVIFDSCDDDWKMRIAVNRHNQECKGTGRWHVRNNSGELILKNVTELSTKMFPYWRIKYNDCGIHITAEGETIKGSYHAVATNMFSAVTHDARGNFMIDHGRLSAQATIDADHCVLDGVLYPEPALKHFSYIDKDDKQLIVLQGMDLSAEALAKEEEQKIAGSIAFPFIRSLLNKVCHYDLQGEGNLDVVAQLSQNHIIADIALNDATIRLPQTYNFIDGLKMRCVCNFADRSVIFKDVHISLHTGKLSCLRATSYLDDTASLNFIHAPILLDRCLLNVNKDLFALVSGNLLFSKKKSTASVEGNIIIDKARLKENLFSGVIQKQLLSYTHSAFSLPDVPLLCDIVIETKSPIRVDTGFFQTNAHVNLRVKKEARDPQVSGEVILHSGVLNFPYKPLYISKGVITFTPEQLFDPIIELVARNKIKKYDVALQVEGSLLTHHIALDATPPLTEEQIVGLLLVGSEENSLNSMMPALIVQNLKNLIVSHNQSSFFDKYFKPLLGGFNINLVPSFTDQSGRGGLRGALEITVDDRWRAVIQKNFSLTEDTKFELEFLFSDDITFRAVRDERRDIGGEVEMRWKF